MSIITASRPARVARAVEQIDDTQRAIGDLLTEQAAATRSILG